MHVQAQHVCQVYVVVSASKHVCHQQHSTFTSMTGVFWKILVDVLLMHGIYIHTDVAKQ